VAAPAETRTPNLHRANKTLIESADGRVATVVVAQKRSFGEPRSIGQEDPAHHRPTFPPSGRVADRSSPSRVRCRRTERALDGSGPLCKMAQLGGKVEFYEKQRQQQQQKHPVVKVLLDIDRHSHGRRLHSVRIFASTCKFALVSEPVPRDAGEMLRATSRTEKKTR
jgi:hypothetical protein